MRTMNEDPGVLDFLVQQFNLNPIVFAVRINDIIYITKKNVMGDGHITIADYDGEAFLVKCFSNGGEVFENITGTPVELTNFIIEKIL